MNIHNSKISHVILLVICGAFCSGCDSQVTNIHPEKEKISLSAKITLPNVTGRIDHITYDPQTHRAFLAAYDNNTVEVVDINTNRVVHTITGLREPQGIIYIPDLRKLVVANGGNGDCTFFDPVTYKQLGVVSLKSDADNIRYDKESHLLYVGHSSGAVALIDANSMKQVADINVDQHPESFQLSKSTDRIYINVPDADQIEVAQLSTNQVVDKWKNTGSTLNFPMALDEKNNRLFVGYRNKAVLRMISTKTGKDIASSKSSKDADDIFYDASDSLVFVSAGAGYIDVYRVSPTDLVVVNHIATVTGARTSLLLVPDKKFLLAVPKHGQNRAALWVYNLR